jgi:DNA sulfur modification protein DndD
MGLKIRQIRLANWKCYQQQTIDFNLNTDKLIWVIFGLNGFGKTSILEAILWCLYGNEAISKSSLIEFFNEIAVKSNPHLEISVQLTLELNNKVYLVSRTARRKIKGTLVDVDYDLEASLIENGKSQTDTKERINFLLPKECREFFFFDGKKIDDYAKMTQTSETKEAIEKILGIPELQNLRKDLGNVSENLQKQLKVANSNSQTFQQKTKELSEAQAEIQVIKAQLKEAEEKLEAAKILAQDTQAVAEQNEELRRIYLEIDKQTKEKESYEEKQENIEEEIAKALRQAAIPLLKDFVWEMVDDLQRENQLTNKKVFSHWQLKELINLDTCICGRCIDEPVRKFLAEQIERLERQEALENSTKEILKQDDLKSRLLTLSRYPTPNIDNLIWDRDEIIEQLDEIDQTINSHKKQTGGKSQREANELWNKAMKEKDNVSNCEKRIERLQQEMGDKQKKYDNLRREMTELGSHSKETKTLSKQLDFADRLHQAVEDLIQWRILERKEKIETSTSAIHRRITNKPFEYIGVKIKDDYSLGVKHLSGNTLNPDRFSPGEKEALAFAFIAGLNQASQVAAPLVMDTPFGHLDGTQKKNIINYLPYLPSQVIVLATDEDLSEEALQKLNPYIAQIQYIRRLDASEYASYVEVE